ncbi:glycosyltransferase family 39 protein [Mycolicibacterium smegmatis]|uniref:glycosyltransferase family 39 protein n=1 Tax=Mycolicibacterium smegmatis TaxID=1772 RepID=UPI0005DA1F58|nr:glycosyltransferase family 39 protein [Mycolicibacterium smegmatis]MDF1903350.1 glycosyltransferase family 39 protein [Mycolicibacterium smegmatis]MDF1904478.1 glycosyltransferase family 39 protein [Mycolicibacterium smegmatis]MDF1918347.1 glycosyltransferase family 39 protein [Mycolicibacterium smegmatis]MDF1923642.1 glycosyltransferase family 39 protein [Mycolicibacterium smegmatis]UGT75811.1 glycosyltransferase family 39 protein [Mycolicibacterium smegmatis]
MAVLGGGDVSRPAPPFAAAAVLPIAALTALAHCAAALLGKGYWFDEVYMLAIGRFHLDWGAADQPPVTPALAALAGTVAPGSLVTLRAPAVLATGCAVVLAALIARELGGRRRAQAVTALAQATALFSTFAGHWLTPYTLEPAQWLLLIWLLVRWIRTRDDRLLVAAGAATGLAAMTKFQVLLLCAVLLLGIAWCGPRALLRRPLLWVGAAVALAMVSPTLVWQHVHGWPQLQMTTVVAGEAEYLYGGRAGVAVQLILFAGVLGVGLGVYGAWCLLRHAEFREYRFLPAVGVVLYVVFVATAGRPYYLGGLYAPFVAAGAVCLESVSPGTVRRWALRVGTVTAVAATVAILVLSVNITPPDVGDRIAKAAATAYRDLPEDERDRTVLLGESYITAAYLDGAAPRYGLPQAYGTNRSYGYFTPPPDTADEALYVGAEPDGMREHFVTVRNLATIDGDLKLFLLRERRHPWPQIWSEQRSLTVS